MLCPLAAVVIRNLRREDTPSITQKLHMPDTQKLQTRTHAHAHAETQTHLKFRTPWPGGSLGRGRGHWRVTHTWSTHGTRHWRHFRAFQRDTVLKEGARDVGTTRKMKVAPNFWLSSTTFYWRKEGSKQPKAVPAAPRSPVNGTHSQSLMSPIDRRDEALEPAASTTGTGTKTADEERNALACTRTQMHTHT